MNHASRLGFILVGTYFLVSGLAALGRLPNEMFHLDSTSLTYTWPQGAWVALAVGLGATLLFWLLPGALLVARSQQLASRLFPETGSPTIDSSGLYVVGCMLLAIYFAISGAGALLSSAISLWGIYRAEFLGSLSFSYLGPLVSAVAQLGAALALYMHSLRELEHSARAA